VLSGGLRKKCRFTVSGSTVTDIPMQSGDVPPRVYAEGTLDVVAENGQLSDRQRLFTKLRMDGSA
jgi:hypothetical protein